MFRPSATDFVAMLADPSDARILRAMAAELAGGVPISTDRDVAAYLAGAVFNGRIRFIARPMCLKAGRESVPQRPKPEGPLAEGPSIGDSFTHWVEVQLVNDQNVGVPGQRCLITTSDGIVHRRHTDSLGFVRLERIPGGACKVSFPDLDAAAWQPVEPSA